MKDKSKLVILMAGLVVLVGLLVSYCGDKPKDTPPAQAPHTPASLEPAVIVQTVTRFVVDTSALVEQRDSLNRIIRRLRTDSTNLAHRQAAADSARDAAVSRAMATAKDTVTMRRDINTILAAGAACRLSLENCEARAQAWEGRALVADQAVKRVVKRTRIVLAIAAGVVTYLVVSK